jgi:hypothetical protein
MQTKLLRFSGAVLALLGGGCAAIQAARMQLPEGLAARSEALAVQGLGGGRSGSFQLGADSGSFERSASRLALFSAALSRDSASARYTLRRTDGSQVQGECHAAQTGAEGGGLAVQLRPWRVSCEWRGGARLSLQGRPGATQETREGRFESAGDQGQVLELRSEHRLQGAAWAQAQPVGYLLLHQGVVVGALDLSDSSRLQLRRPPAGQPLHDAVTQAALALALLWDPAAP